MTRPSRGAFPRIPSSRLALATAAIGAIVVLGCGDDDRDPVADALAQSELRDDMTKLWEDHVTWTRLVIVSLAADAPDTDAAVARLLQNQVDIGDAFEPYYGVDAAAELTALLHEHIVLAAELIVAAKAGDTDEVTRVRELWYANADEIADFLAAANPVFWPQATMRELMRHHLDHTLAEAVHQLEGDFEASIADYEEVHVQILGFSDVLSDGVIRHFPDEFGARVPPSPASELDDALDKLWEDHITWTRLVIVSAVAGSNDLGSTIDRLQQNQVDIGDAIRPFYGDNAGTQLTALLGEHIDIAIEIVGAAIIGDTVEVNELTELWGDNADQIADFLAAANPNWQQAEMRRLMRQHLDHTLSEAVHQIEGDYEASITAYETVHLQILEMSEVLSDGIVAQFPERF